MRGGRGRAPRVTEIPKARLNPEKLRVLVMGAGPILSLAGAVILAGGLVVWLTIRELRNPALILISLALIMLVTSLLTHLPAVISAVTARTGRYAANTIVMVAALTAILALVGFISFENSYRLDTTATRQFTLAPQTKKILNDLDIQVEATLYSSPDDVRQERIKRQADDFFFEFNQRNRKFTYKFVDPDLKPSQARLDGVTEYPTVVFKLLDSHKGDVLETGTQTAATSTTTLTDAAADFVAAVVAVDDIVTNITDGSTGSVTEVVDINTLTVSLTGGTLNTWSTDDMYSIADATLRNPYLLTPIFFGTDFALSEQDLVSAILISTGEQQKVVYFTTGHRERDSGETGEDSGGYGLAHRGLLGDNYRVRTVNLNQVGVVPPDAAVLIIAGPSGSFLVDERDKIEQYLRNGGRAMFLLDNAVNSQLNKLLNKWGIDLPEGTVVDIVNSAVGDPRSLIVRRGDYNPDSPITRPLDDTFFIESTAIQDIIKRAPEGLPPNPDEVHINLIPLAMTSMFSCVTTDRYRSHCAEDDDIFGPFPIAMAIEAVATVGEDPPQASSGGEVQLTSMVIFGDSDFASNNYYFALNNSDFFLNAVDWLAQKYDLISIRSKPQAFRELIIDQEEFDFIRYSSWFLLPTGIMLLAGIAWWRRR